MTIKWTGPISFECGDKEPSIYITDNKIIFDDGNQKIVLFENQLLPKNVVITDYELLMIILMPDQDFDFNLYIGGKNYNNIIVSIQEYKYVTPTTNTYGQDVDPQYDEFANKLILKLELNNSNQQSVFMNTHIYNTFIWFSPSTIDTQDGYNLIKPMMLSNISDNIIMKTVVLLFNVEQKLD